jgi:hypothetical protein
VCVYVCVVSIFSSHQSCFLTCSITDSDDDRLSDTDSIFSLIPISSNVCKSCRDSFKIVIKDKQPQSANRLRQLKSAAASDGVREFYTSFYDRLMALPSKQFESIIRPGGSDKNQATRRGAILMRMVRFVLSIQEETDEVCVH